MLCSFYFLHVHRETGSLYRPQKASCPRQIPVLSVWSNLCSYTHTSRSSRPPLAGWAMSSNSILEGSHSCRWEILCTRWPGKCKSDLPEQIHTQDGCPVPHKPRTNGCTHLHLRRKTADVEEQRQYQCLLLSAPLCGSHKTWDGLGIIILEDE